MVQSKFHARVLTLFKVGRAVPVATLSLAICFFLGINSAKAQYTTNGTGGGAWTSGTTWQGGQVPPAGSDVTIASNDSVWTSLSAQTGCGALDIQSGAKLNVLGQGIVMTGAFSIGAGAMYINNTDSAKAWPAGASGYTIDPTSTFILGPSGNATLGWNQSDSTFGNVIIEQNSNSSGPACGANLTIEGNLTVAVGQGDYFRGIAVSAAASAGVTGFVHQVKGSVTVVSGNWAAVDMGVSATVPLSCTWDVDGNVTVGDPSTAPQIARFSPITSEDDLGAIGTFNIKGNLSFINGGRLAAGSNSGSNQSPNQYATVNVQGNLSFDSTAKFGVNSMGNFDINFTGTKPQTVTLGTNVSFSHSGPPQCSVWDTVAAGANVTFTGGHYWRSAQTLAPNGGGAFVVNGTLNIDAQDTIMGTQNFILSPGGTLGIGSPDGITASTDANPNTGNIEVDSARVFSSEANYVYNGTVAQKTGSGLPATVNNLTIDDTAGVTLSQVTTINGVLDLKAGIFDNTIGFTLGPSGKISYDGGKLLTGVEQKDLLVPQHFYVDQNYPNPFNPSTTIQFGVPSRSFVTVKVFDVLGQEVATIFSGEANAGDYTATFNAASLSSGVYFYRIQAGNWSQTKRMMFVK